MNRLQIVAAFLFVAAPQVFAQQVEPPTNPKPVKTVPIKARTEPIKCEDGWTAVLLANGKPMCARELKDPNG